MLFNEHILLYGRKGSINLYQTFLSFQKYTTNEKKCMKKNQKVRLSQENVMKSCGSSLYHNTTRLSTLKYSQNLSNFIIVWLCCGVSKHNTTNKIIKTKNIKFQDKVKRKMLIIEQKCIVTRYIVLFSTILTSDSELILSTYMVTPTSTGGPVNRNVHFELSREWSMNEYNN